MNKDEHPNNIYVDHYVKFLIIKLTVPVHCSYPDFNLSNKFRLTVERTTWIAWGH